MKTIFSILVALGIPAAFWNYYYKETPDVQYSISASIPLVFDEAASSKSFNREYIQQIEVANSGKGEAKKIVVKLSGSISQFYLSKHSVSEEPIIKNDANGFELVYTNLPPSTAFQLTVKTNSDLTKQQIDVFHQAGKARFISPSTRKSDLGLMDAIWLALPLIYLVGLYSTTRDDFKYRYLFRKYSTDIAELLKNKRPWYISEKVWPEILDDLITRSISAPISLYSSVSRWPQYVLLNSERPTDLSQATWDGLKDKASQIFIDALKLKARQVSSKAEIYDLLALQWPAGLSETNRESATKALSDIYLKYILTNSSTDELAKLLTADDKPSLIATRSWEKFKDNAETEILKTLANRIIENPSIDTETLPEWSALSTLRRYKISTLKEFQSNIRKADTKFDLAKQASEQVKNLEIEVSRREAAIAAAEERNQKLQNKVTLQLNVIDKLINDPSYLDRIESYDDTFASGNWALLRKLVSIPK